ncbi:lysozyme inhibitor LprI family protein [Methylobacterium sp. GC_Met_2]|uniref:lysozyme inhibitor LprI family protein n=1 Tax=Methylobacterium sp. GC_Met_2 TaxID=2937376 RepID=UPI00226B8176|nr:lysozyme inhibitor LprI family protein [Methylobacterium sp. GC_Met_2]
MQTVTRDSTEMQPQCVRFCGAAAMAVLLLAAAPASAAGPCEGSTQADLNECAAADYGTADQALNTVYGQLMKKIGPKAKDGLRAAQKAWLPFRDATCALETMGLEGGSAYSMEYDGCRKGLTDQRIKVLKGYLSCKSDEISCVGQMTE